MHGVNDDAGFFGDLAAYRLLGSLAGFDESGEGREPSGRPRMLASEQGTVLLVGDQHDHGWVDPREVR